MPNEVNVCFFSQEDAANRLLGGPEQLPNQLPSRG